MLMPLAKDTTRGSSAPVGRLGAKCDRRFRGTVRSEAEAAGSKVRAWRTRPITPPGSTLLPLRYGNLRGFEWALLDGFQLDECYRQRVLGAFDVYAVFSPLRRGELELSLEACAAIAQIGCSVFRLFELVQ